MTFSEYLNQLPSTMVFEGLLKNSTLPRRIISSAMVGDIARQFSSEKTLAERFLALSENARFSCGLAYLFDAPGLLFDRAPHIAAAISGKTSLPSGKNDDPDLALRTVLSDELILSFLVYGARDDFGNIYFVGFKEFEPKLRKLCCQAIVRHTQISDEKEAQYRMPALFLHDVTAAVGLASQGALKKTKLGPLGKTSSQSISKVLHLTHAPFDSPKTEERLPILPLNYALSRGLLRGIGDEYVAMHRKMLDWLSQPIETRCGDFIEFAGSSLRLWRMGLFNDLFHAPGKPWLSCALFGERLSEEAAASVKMLAYCGLADIHKSGGNIFFTRAARGVSGPPPAGENRGPARMVLMPDFSALIPQEIPLEHLYWFSKFGNLLSFDKIYKGTINREIINGSLNAGIAGEELLAWLDRWQAPKNVAETVKEWIREFSRISLETATFIVSAEEKVTKQLLSYAPLKNDLELISGHRIFRVVAGREHHVNQILVSMGFDARTPKRLKADHDENRPESLWGNSFDAAKLFPIISGGKPEASSSTTVKQGKYSPQLKVLDLTDLMHVLDYALLMGHNLRFEYSGSPYIKKDLYLARPLSYKKGLEPELEAEVTRTKKKKVFLINRIVKIGVEPAND